MPWKPSEPGELPTLGYGVIDWIETYLAHPAYVDVRPWKLYREFEDFILRFYVLDPRASNPIYQTDARGRRVLGRRRIKRALFGRSRGWSKSPALAALMLAEACGPVIPNGWDANGQPVGVSWSDTTPFLGQITAVSEDQTANTWRPLLRMCDGPIADEYPELEPLGTFVNTPGGGKIENRTSSGSTIKGAPSQFVVLDQTEEWTQTNGGIDLADTIRDNCAKVGGSSIESPNAFIPGDKTVAEASAAWADSIRAKKALSEGFLHDHREAPSETDLYDRESVTLGLRVAYGDASGHKGGCLIHKPPCKPGHVDLESIIDRIWQSDYDPQKARANFLNQITHATNALLSQPEWGACKAKDGRHVPLKPRDIITLGFDGSRGRAKGKPDATALIGCRLSDLHLFQIGVWEAGDNRTEWDTWTPPIIEVDAAVRSAFKTYRVAGFYADPARDWRSHVNTWEADLSSQLVTYTKDKTKRRIEVTRDHPFEWWMTGGRAGLVERIVKQFIGSVQNQEVTHDGSHELTRHVLNTRRALAHGKLSVSKKQPQSADKIDACVAAILALAAAFEAIAAGIGKEPQVAAPYRIR